MFHNLKNKEGKKGGSPYKYHYCQETQVTKEIMLDIILGPKSDCMGVWFMKDQLNLLKAFPASTDRRHRWNVEACAAYFTFLWLFISIIFPYSFFSAYKEWMKSIFFLNNTLRSVFICQMNFQAPQICMSFHSQSKLIFLANIQ